MEKLNYEIRYSFEMIIRAIGEVGQLWMARTYVSSLKSYAKKKGIVKEKSIARGDLEDALSNSVPVSTDDIMRALENIRNAAPLMAKRPLNFFGK